MIRRGPSRRCSFNGGQNRNQGPTMKCSWFILLRRVGWALQQQREVLGYEQAKMGFLFDD
jgi:hypothetical protein